VALTALAYFFDYRALWRVSTPAALPQRLIAVTLTAAAVGLLVWAALWAVLYSQRLMQPATLAWFLVLCAAQLCWRRVSSTLKLAPDYFRSTKTRSLPP
jgi:uncharacterized membrane protein YqjE